MVPMLAFLVCLASQGAPVKSNTEILPPQEGEGTINSEPTTSEYIKCGHITEDKTFQSIFRSPHILLEFLNDVFKENPIPNVSKLTKITIPAAQQSPGMYSENQYHIIHDVLARDDQGNAYVIEMERIFQTYDLIRFQYSIARAFIQVIDESFKKLDKKATKTAEVITKAEIKVKEEVELKEKLKSKPVSNQLIFKPQDAPTPTVICIVIVEDGLPVKHFRSKFLPDKYTVVSSFENFGQYSKMNFVLIDLKVFSKTNKLENPETPLDWWCQLLWTAKDGKISKDWLDKYENFPGIKDAAEMLLKMPNQDVLESHARRIKEATLREEGRNEAKLEMARKMLKDKQDDAMIMKYAEISQKQLEELKSSS